MIELQNIRKVFNEGRTNEYIALHDLSLTIAAHQVTALTGPSGSGKTTLLSLLGCMARPTSGRIVLEGGEITSLPERFLTDIRRKTLGLSSNNSISSMASASSRTSCFRPIPWANRLPP